MRIALIGNSNNNFFCIARHLRDRGYTPDLYLLNNELSHFSPSADTYSLSFMQYTFSLPFGNCYWFLKELEDKKTLACMKMLREYDCIFASGSAMAYLEYFGIGVRFFIPYGMDLVNYPFYVESANPNHREHLDAFSIYQQRAIKNCEFILGTEDLLGLDGYKKPIEDMGASHKLRLFKTFPYIYHRDYQRDRIHNFFHKCDWAEDFRDISESSGFVVFHHARHTWKSRRGDISDKANDRVFRAFASVVEEHKALNPTLISFEYGSDFLDTKELIRELGIQQFVRWMPIMRRKDIMVGLHYANVATGQFEVGCCGGGGANRSISSFYSTHTLCEYRKI